MSEDFFGPAQQNALEMARLAGEMSRKLKLKPEELESVKARAEAIKKAIEAEGPRARWRIEVTFNHGRKTHVASVGAMQVYRCGNVFGGGADEVAYPCPYDGCLGYITHEFIDTETGQGVCPTCHRGHQEDQRLEGRAYNIPVEGWAEVLEREFRRCSNMADILIKTPRADIRAAAMKEQMSERRGEDLFVSRDLVKVRYSLKQILKDTSKGGLYEKLLAFLKA